MNLHSTLTGKAIPRVLHMGNKNSKISKIK